MKEAEKDLTKPMPVKGGTYIRIFKRTAQYPIGPTTLGVLDALVRCCDRSTLKCIKSDADLAHKSKFCRRVVVRERWRLWALGLLTWERRSCQKGRLANEYTLHLDVPIETVATRAAFLAENAASQSAFEALSHEAVRKVLDKHSRKVLDKHRVNYVPTANNEPTATASSSPTASSPSLELFRIALATIRDADQAEQDQDAKQASKTPDEPLPDPRPDPAAADLRFAVTAQQDADVDRTGTSTPSHRLSASQALSETACPAGAENLIDAPEAKLLAIFEPGEGKCRLQGFTFEDRRLTGSPDWWQGDLVEVPS